MFIFQTLAGLPDQDSYYDMVDCLEEQGVEAMAQRHLSRKGTDLDLVEQINIYEVRKPGRPLSHMLFNICIHHIIESLETLAFTCTGTLMASQS